MLTALTKDQMKIGKRNLFIAIITPLCFRGHQLQLVRNFYSISFHDRCKNRVYNNIYKDFCVSFRRKNKIKIVKRKIIITFGHFLLTSSWSFIRLCLLKKHKVTLILKWRGEAMQFHCLILAWNKMKHIDVFIGASFRNSPVKEKNILSEKNLLAISFL